VSTPFMPTNFSTASLTIVIYLSRTYGAVLNDGANGTACVFWVYVPHFSPSFLRSRNLASLSVMTS
jgi:hypothetical protein